MELFPQLFGDRLAFVYHCFDRIVIYGYLSGLSRPEQVVHFFRQVVGAPVVSKELLSQRTSDYQNWVEAFARNHKVPIQWAEKGVRKEDYVQPWLRRMSMASTSSSRAWSRGRPSVSPCRSIPLRIPTTASWLARGAASRTTTSTSAMKFSVPLSCVWRRFSPSRQRITSTATALSSRNSTVQRSAFASPTTRSWLLMTSPRCKRLQTN